MAESMGAPLGLDNYGLNSSGLDIISRTENQGFKEFNECFYYDRCKSTHFRASQIFQRILKKLIR
jgi:hypothetical protein